MQDFRWWAFWRRLQYGLGYTAVVMAALILVYYQYWYEPASCFDNQQNGSEQGVDCGGACTRICAFTVAPPTVVWAQSFLITPGQYNAVAYIDNRNVGIGSPELRYTFRLRDADGVITERSGVTHLPPDNTFPVFEGRIETGSRVPTETELVLESPDIWLPSNYDRTQFRVASFELLGVDVRPRLNAEIENTALTDVRGTEVVAVIFDAQGTALTASQTFVDLPSRARTGMVFTWPRPIAKTLRTCDVPSDIMMVLDRSGSMAADGGDPPEPLESAKQAAQQFVSLLRVADQIGFVSYATTPSSPIEQVLTSQKDRAQSAIAATVMGQDGVQYTDMGAVFRVAAAELTSERHRDNARKVIVFMTDGDVTRPLNPAGERDVAYAAEYARLQAKAAKDQDIIIYTIGFGNFFRPTSDVIERDVNLIRDLASDPDKSFLAPTIADLSAVYRDIAEDICEEGAAKIDILPKGPGNFAPYP